MTDEEDESNEQTYSFPDKEDIPTIQLEADDYEYPEPKTLVVQYDGDEWDESAITQTVQTLNWLFGRDVQVAVVDERLEFLAKDEVETLLADLYAGDLDIPEDEQAVEILDGDEGDEDGEAEVTDDANE